MARKSGRRAVQTTIRPKALEEWGLIRIWKKGAALSAGSSSRIGEGEQQVYCKGKTPPLGSGVQNLQKVGSVCSILQKINGKSKEIVDRGSRGHGKRKAHHVRGVCRRA